MAAQSAHLTFLDLVNPSIFDFIAQESLNDLLHPAIRKVFESFCIKFPKLLPLIKQYDEVFLGSSCLLQFYYLKNYGASFSECLYGLRRVGSSGGKLTKKELLLSLAALTVVPYLLQRLQAKAEESYFSQDHDRYASKSRIIKLNSLIQVTYQLARFVHHLQFISGRTQYNSPLLLMAGLRLVVDDPAQQDQSSRNWLTLAIQRGFELGAFFLQCYQSWQSDEHRSFSSLQAIPPPPKMDCDGTEIRVGDSLCEICHGPRQLDTALSVSGRVFCFICIQHYVGRHQCCPITKLPATFNDLIRLYPDSS